MRKKLGLIAGIVLLIIFLIGGKRYLDKKAVEKSYQDGVELIQNYVSDYLVKNYEGIEKIEWQGVGVEWRSSPVFGSSMFGNYVDSDVKVFVSKDQFFTMDFTLTDETEYDDDLQKYVLKESLNPKNIDSLIEMEIENTTRKMNAKDKANFKKIKKNNLASSNVQVIYNLDIHGLTY